jgi:hypothetical protein
MARVQGNIITTGLRGKVGNLVFRKRGKKTTAYIMSERKVPLSKAQKDAQIRFAQAVALAKEALQHDEQRLAFEKMAKTKGRESAYSAAVAHFMSKVE